MEASQEMFNSLVDRYSERLYWHIRGIVGSHEDADDVLQDVFMKAWKALPGFRGDSSELTWLWRIADNEALSHLRRLRLRRIFSPGLESSEVLSTPSDSGVDGDSLQSLLSRAIASLPPKQRSVFCMRYFEDLSYKEMSEITGTSEGALKASYHQAREKILREVENLE